MTRDKIRKEASIILSEDGLSALSLSYLSSRLNLSKSSLYNYYKSKEEIVDDIFSYGHLKMMQKRFSLNLSDGIKTIIDKAYLYWEDLFSSEDTNTYLRIVFSLHYTDKKAEEEFRSLSLMLDSQARVIISSLKTTEEKKRIISRLLSSFLFSALEKYLNYLEFDFKKELEEFVLLFT